MTKLDFLFLGLIFIPFIFGKFRARGLAKVSISSVFAEFFWISTVNSQNELNVAFVMLTFFLSFLGIGIMYLGSIAEADERADLLTSNGVEDKHNPYIV
jgi:hypothetical protein